jgi:hypothetical protein
MTDWIGIAVPDTSEGNAAAKAIPGASTSYTELYGMSSFRQLKIPGCQYSEWHNRDQEEVKLETTTLQEHDSEMPLAESCLPLYSMISQRRHGYISKNMKCQDDVERMVVAFQLRLVSGPLFNGVQIILAPIFEILYQYSVSLS